MKRFLKDYGLSVVLTALFLLSWILQTWMGWPEYVSEQRAHGEAATVFGDSGYIWMWGESTFENWTSEFLQLLTFVVLTSFLIHRGSAESKDGQERIERKIDILLSEAGRGE